MGIINEIKLLFEFQTDMFGTPAPQEQTSMFSGGHSGIKKSLDIDLKELEKELKKTDQMIKKAGNSKSKLMQIHLHLKSLDRQLGLSNENHIRLYRKRINDMMDAISSMIQPDKHHSGQKGLFESRK